MKILHIEQRCRRGFTLIEMMVVFFIVLALLATSVPFFTGFSSSTGIRTAERGVGTALRTARSYAISGTYNIAGNANVNVVCDTGVTPNTYRITDSSGATKDRTYQLPQGVTFTAAATFTFIPSGGLALGSDTSVTIRSTKGATKTIDVQTVTGAVTMQ